MLELKNLSILLDVKALTPCVLLPDHTHKHTHTLSQCLGMFAAIVGRFNDSDNWRRKT